MSDLEREHYTEKQVSKLRKQLGLAPMKSRVGQAICPHCKHLEARWRSEVDPAHGGQAMVRVRCSQCQLSAVFRVP
ncbi:MAG: hypothetical protein U1E76_28125 [Planctomycetota bacterium]